MSLYTYRKKRDFGQTPEPAGKEAKQASKGFRFVIQKHAASRLHYDFRLELDGVLKSWAVPKGPSLDPSDRMLAVEVEDHPLEYASFEGVIPQGHYGGGTVMVWDQGVWKPEGDAAKSYRQGRLRFRLLGEKLHGRWSLVRMKGRKDERQTNWLLIKGRDDEARTRVDFDVREERPESVLTGRTLDSIASEADRVWTKEGEAVPAAPVTTSPEISRPKRKRGPQRQTKTKDHLEVSAIPGAKASTFPKHLSPQLAVAVEYVPSGEEWLHELKFDGYRILAFKHGENVRLETRRGLNWSDRFPGIRDAVARMPVTDAIIDGEVVALRSDGTTDFQALQNLMKHGKQDLLVYYVFDLPFCQGHNLATVPLLARKELLARIVTIADQADSPVVRYSNHIRGQGADVFEHSCRYAMEGIVCKRADSPYESRRSAAWLKVKCLKRQEFVIGGYTAPKGSRSGFGSLLVGVYDGKHLIYCGHVGTGFTADSLQQLSKDLKSLQVAESPFHEAPAEARKGEVTWVEPHLVAEVEFSEWTKDGILRQPSFQGLREDKPAKEVVQETTVPARSAIQQDLPPKTNVQRSVFHTTPSKNGAIEVGGVRLSNPDRVLYPEQGITKQELAEYYVAIADWILPHLVDRPLTLVRCPRGRQSHCFYQKHLDELPTPLGSIEIQESTGLGTYAVVRDIAGLVSLVQLGVLELHPWGSRVDRIERPDQLVFDLDPGEATDWKHVVQGALKVRQHLEQFGLQSFVRTSGGKGLHVVVPITRRIEWDDAKAFAKSVAESIARSEPDHYVSVMTRSKRKGKVFIDYLRNGRGATAIATYCTRARTDAPVAMPVEWKDLPSLRSEHDFTLRRVEDYLQQRKSDPWSDFFRCRQSITKRMLDG